MLVGNRRSRPLWLLVGLSLVALGIWGVQSRRAPDSFSPSDGRRAFHELRKKLDATYPARGPTDYPGHHVEDVPKGFAMVVLAEITYRSANPEHPLTLARAAGRWLLQHRDANGDGVIGWGVPVAWDAYGDGSVNPANTEYTISTAIAVHALLDWLEADSGAPAAEILATVEAALAPYVDVRMRSPSGLLPYSLTVADRRYDTFNPAAYLAGQMQRFSTRRSGESAAALRAAADQTMEVLLATRQVHAIGGWFWNYSVQEVIPNDLAHAMYIVQGIQSYAAHGGRHAAAFDLMQVSRHLDAFLRSDNAFVSAWPSFRKDIAYPARSYDLGMGLATAVRYSTYLPIEVASRIAMHIPSYRRADGWYRKYPAAGEKPAGDDLVVGEYQAYILYGLAAWATRDGRR